MHLPCDAKGLMCDLATFLGKYLSISDIHIVYRCNQRADRLLKTPLSTQTPYKKETKRTTTNLSVEVGGRDIVAQTAIECYVYVWYLCQPHMLCCYVWNMSFLFEQLLPSVFFPQYACGRDVITCDKHSCAALVKDHRNHNTHWINDICYMTWQNLMVKRKDICDQQQKQIFM